MEKLNKKCPHCGGNAKINTRQIRFLVRNYAGGKLIHMGAQAVCQKCKARGPATNGDKLRQMSDIQLAKWVCSVHGSCPRFCPMADDCDGIDCDGAWLDWLKQEVESDG